MSDTEERHAKRSRRDVASRKAKAFEKFKQLKSGNRKKYEEEELDSVYETVDEKEYTKRVLSRQDDDWIVDDDGNGYVEDGREIFDDDLDSESVAAAAAASNSKGKGIKRKKKQQQAVSANAGKGNLQYLLSNMSSKQKKEDKNLDNDETLSELLGEIDKSDSGSGSSSVIKPKPFTSSFSSCKQVAKDYLKKFSPIVKPALEASPMISEIQKTNDSTISSSTTTTSYSEESANEKTNTNNVEKEEFKIESTIKSFDDDLLLDMSGIDELEEQQQQQQEEAAAGTEINKWDNFKENLMDWEQQQQTSGNNLSLENNFEEITSDEDFDKSGVENDNENSFRFFWWDAYEDANNQPGVVLLFGKTYSVELKKYISCCVQIRNIERKLYFLPKNEPDIGIQDVYKEIVEEIMKKKNIKSFRAKPVHKKYAFDESIPIESDYIEVRYSAKEPSIDKDSNGKTFSKVFGTETSYLEIILLERKIKGPCWLDIKNAEVVTNPYSWCKIEMNCSNPNNLKILQSDKSSSSVPPPLIVATINLRFTINPKTNQQEIVMIGCVVQNQYVLNKEPPLNKPFQNHFCVFTSPKQQILPIDLQDCLKSYKLTSVQRVDSERALINYFINQFIKFDPDLIVGHDLQGYQMNVLVERLYEQDNKNFSKLGRIKRNLSTAASVKEKKFLERTLFVGRLVCDIKISAKELIKSRSYDLDNLCENVLKLKETARIDLEADDIYRMYERSETILKLIALTMQDCAFILKIMYSLNIIPMALQITNISGNIMSKTLLGGRSERNEYLLLHAFYEKDYIVPDKIYYSSLKTGTGTTKRRKPAYSGGLVLEPKVGFYDKLILLMDFNSLYPSIIQEYNICFTTMPAFHFNEDNNLPAILPSQAQSQPLGILPREIRKLVESRREVKKLMNNSEISADLKNAYNIRQMALKLTANSMYGCLGFSNSRFYAKNLAALITHKGREILINTKDLVERMSFDVIYGDTDSIMINTNLLDIEEVYKIANKIKLEINKLYKQIELDLDGVFKYLLLLKKKKYAAVTLTKTKNGQFKTDIEYKGLDIVRRDWSKLAAEAGKFVLKQILSDQNTDDRIENIQRHLEKLKEDLENQRVPISLLVIEKQLTKNPNLYADKNTLPHVQVALRYNEISGGHLRAGDTVPYVICCDDDPNKPATQRAYHLEEVEKNSSNLKIDVNYYLAQQIHPVVSRICEPIEGIDPYRIADFLGIDSNAFKQQNKSTTTNNNNDEITNYWENITKADVKFRNVEKFKFKCLTCKEDNEVDDGSLEFLEKCRNTNCKRRPIDYLAFIQNQLVRKMNEFIKIYYKCEMTCDDPMCNNSTNRISVHFAGRYPICTLCYNGLMLRTYTENALYLQLKYFHYIFDLNRFHKKPSIIDERIESGLNSLKELVNERLNQTTYTIINLKEVFDYFDGGIIKLEEINNEEILDDFVEDDDYLN